MKRRNAEIGKMRRPMKRSKITEGIYGSTLLYLKFLVLWMLVILADFILEFRFEFLWPFYLLLRSVYDSFKYQGLVFSFFFVCIALTSDVLCFFFIPVHWLFFAASTYVWVQYVWHTDKGICAPTVILWVLFVYLEAAVRLRDVKHMPGHLDLCRPFAAHCIGYPVVTLGFGFKSYVGYRMRQRRQRDVAKENEFYYQLMQQALPVDTSTALVATTAPTSTTTPAINSTAAVTTTTATSSSSTDLAIVPAAQSLQHHSSGAVKVQQHHNHHHGSGKENKNGHIPNGAIANGGVNHSSSRSHRKSVVDKCKQDQHNNNNDEQQQQHSNSSSRHSDRHIDKQKVNHSHSNGSAVGAGAGEDSAASQSQAEQREQQQQQAAEQRSARRREKKEQDKEREAAEHLQKLESDARRLRIDLQGSRSSEQELRLQVAALTTSEKVSKGELSTLQREIEDLQQRLQSAVSSRTSDKQAICNLERRIADERRTRCTLESQLNLERKNRKQEEARAAQVVAQSSRGECTEACKVRRRELENELADCRSSKHWAEERYAAVERENAALVDQLRDTDILMTALTALQEKNAHLENSLSAETRIKLDLFSALGEAKRQLEIRESSNRTQEREIEELKGKIAQVLAVMPNDTFNGPTSTSNMSRVRLAESPPGSTLDPNATAYTPKSSLVASTEA